ncbi:hypothetical protein K3495_g5283 [Podosphaera aphanis]|nr:hypothetical protein K3495_g5283 [Podosphaera aphanis]
MAIISANNITNEHKSCSLGSWNMNSSKPSSQVITKIQTEHFYSTYTSWILKTSVTPLALTETRTQTPVTEVTSHEPAPTPNHSPAQGKDSVALGVSFGLISAVPLIILLMWKLLMLHPLRKNRKVAGKRPATTCMAGREKDLKFKNKGRT